ncbi:hypothetical protein AMRN_1412 [Malaciobacter marinus]|uniref:Lipoprotein n=1 Tax=Malaciobacter marinus TaxID=505249 RepID=A0A347TKM0_9BACT|nr:hypothetical protein [Malaciobacter marinus]AXX87148.1 hypothetical protein AMRN_1412 [Malaciobacter marinus]PHO14812.1 hypothetical protein CPH92_09505 [Malaciobacter marinus]
MKKNIFIAITAATVMIGCAKQPIATVEATDYAMSCEALIHEIKEIRTQLSNEENKNLAKNVVGKVMTLGIYSADEEEEIMLRERAKSLQLIYTIKQAKGECKALTREDIKIDNAVIQTTKEAKETINSLKE